MKTVYIAWNDIKEKKWHTVGRLCYEKNQYIFCYTRGAVKSNNFVPFGMMNKLDKIYISTKLPPLFENRILNSKRPEFNKFLNWLAIDKNDYDLIDVLALTEGKRGTDSIEIFPYPSIKKNVMTINFFSHGLNHINKWAEGNLDSLKEGSRLYPCKDSQNEKDKNAVLLRSGDPITFVGYCPRYLASDFLSLLEKDYVSNIKVVVKKINVDAPLSYHVLCTMTAVINDNFTPYTQDEFITIPDEVKVVCNDTSCSVSCN